MKNNIINITKAQHAFVSHPIIIVDDKLEPEFFNPAAIASEYILLTPQSIKEGLSETNVQLLEKCLKNGKAVEFTQEIGLTHKKEHRIQAKRHKQGLMLNFYEKQNNASVHDLLQKVDPNQERMHLALHQILTSSEVMSLTDKWSREEMASALHTQAMRAIRVMHLSELPQGKHPYMAVDAGALLDRLCNAAVEYINEHTELQIKYHPIQGECTLKCNPSLMRDILYSCFAALMFHTHNDITVNCSYMGNTMMINMITCGQAGDTEAAGAELVPALFGLAVPAEMIRRQQGEMTLTTIDSGRMALRIVMPCAQLEAALNERLGEFLQESLNTLEMHFSELI